ncbi:MAG: HlyD family efflux transporter periplasmic adaptor subunit [Lachnospiraceae bacterium]|nr:HlyD family efflux transporter periplasmic adaptor subunit [Lachnospiraceae bacterium]
MSRDIKSINELRDSRLLFEKEPPAFGYFFILLVSVVIAFVIIWSIKTPKKYIIQAHGTITNDSGSYVMCSNTGEITDCNMTEGQLVKEGDVLFTIKSTEYDLQKVQLEENKKSYEESIRQYQKLIKSIKDDYNYFDESDSEEGLYWSMYEAYKSQIGQSQLDVSTYQAYGYSEEQIQTQLDINQNKISDIYYSSIQNAEVKIEELKAQISAIDAQLLAVANGQNASRVTATTSGTLHLLGEFKNGVVVQTTTAVATITPENTSKIVEAYVSTADMARMHVDDSAQIVVDGLAQNVYGTIAGKILSIDSDVTVQEGSDGSKNQVFKIKISLPQDYLLSKKGDKVDIVNGMTAKANIQYDKVTYFNYVLEKLGVKIR